MVARNSPLNCAPRDLAEHGATVGFTVNGHDYVAYAPTGAGWTRRRATSIASNLAGKNYYTVAVLPTTAGEHGQRANRLAARSSAGTPTPRSPGRA